MIKLFSLTILIAILSGCSALLPKPETDWTVEEFYDRAKSDFDDSQWSGAIEYYEKLKANFPYGDYAEQAYLELAYAYYRYDEPLSAMRELDEFIRLYPKHPQLAYAYYLKALAADSINSSWLDRFVTDPANRDTKSTLEAYRAYQEVITRYPNSQYAIVAKQRLIMITNRLARRDLIVAQYYFKRGAYLAAANRAQAVLESYPRSHSVRPALALLHESYTKLGMTENAKQIEQIIEFNRMAKFDDSMLENAN